VEIIKRFSTRISAWAGKVKTAVGVREFLALLGFCSFFHGLYLWSPQVAFSACGILLMVVGYWMGDK